MIINYIDEKCHYAETCRWAYPNDDGAMWCKQECKKRRFQPSKKLFEELIGKRIIIEHSEEYDRLEGWKC